MDKIAVIKNIVLILFLVLASYTDIKERKIYNKLILVMLIFGILFLLISFDITDIVLTALAMAIAGIVFVGTYLFSKSNLGEGDIKLAICVSMYVGLFDFINIMIYSLLYTIVFGVVMYIFKRNKNIQLPFAPFVLLGCITNLFFYIIM